MPMEEKTPLTGEEVVFPDPPVIEPCSVASCGKGHNWKFTLANVNCGGCQSPTLAVKLENCPVCNEPMERIRVRLDFVARGGGISYRCKHQEPWGESVDIEVERNGWREFEEKDNQTPAEGDTTKLANEAV